jgi:outer membrane protein
MAGPIVENRAARSPVIALICFIALFADGAVPRTWAADTAAAAVSLDETRRRVLSNNPDVGELAAMMDQARHATAELRSQRGPKISGVGQYTTSDDAFTQLPDSNQLVVRAEQSVFQGGRLASDINRLSRLEQSAAADLDTKKIEVTLLAEQNYFRALADQEQLDLWTQAQAEYNGLLKLIEPKFTVGSVPEYDFVKIKLSISQYELEKLKAREDLSHALSVLGAAMGGDAPAAVQSLSDPGPPPELALPALLATLPQRPDVRSAEQRAAAEALSVERARRQRWPTVTMAADYGYSGTEAQDTDIGWEFSALANLPLYDFGTVRQKVSQAEAGRAAEIYRAQSLRLRIRTEMNDALERVSTAWQSLLIARQNLAPSEKAYKNSLRRYRTALAPMTELSDAHDLWVQSRLRISQSLNEYRDALSALGAAQGHLP